MTPIVVVRDVPSLRAAVAAARARGERVAFVPTMGALHEGHLQLIDRARAQAACVVLSIFVNPLQFAPTEDLSRYPRTEAADLAAAEARGCSIAFVPPVEVMYPGPPAVSVVPQALAERWEGALRPGHFAGVLTVVAKLFNMVRPDVAVFGQKDLQQVLLVQALVRDLDFALTIDVAPIVREADGLAMSSRNRYLAPEERRIAATLPQVLADVADAWHAGARDVATLLRNATARLDAEPAIRPDYLAVVDPATLAPRELRAEAGDYVILAARVGATRLLDNHRLGDPTLPLP